MIFSAILSKSYTSYVLYSMIINACISKLGCDSVLLVDSKGWVYVGGCSNVGCTPFRE